MKILLFADPHVRASSPPSRRDDYVSTVLGKLRQILQAGAKHGVEEIFCLGDLFHFKAPGRTPYWLVYEINKIFKEWKPIRMVLGNHDLQSAGIASLYRQPVAALLNAGTITVEDRYIFPGLVVDCLHHDANIRQDWKSRIQRHPLMSREGLLLAHLDISPGGHHGQISYQEIGELEYRWVIYGHMHENHPFTLSGGSEIAGLASLTRGTISVSDYLATPSYYVFDSETGVLIRHVIDFAPPEEVFRIGEHIVIKERQGQLTEFVSFVQGLDFSMMSIPDALDSLKKSMPFALYNKMVHYIEESS